LGLVVFSVRVLRLLGGLLITALDLYGSFPAAHSCVWPGLVVFGYGLTCSGPLSPLFPEALLAGTEFRYGLLEGIDSLLSTSSITTTLNCSAVLLPNGSDTRLPVLRKNNDM